MTCSGCFKDRAPFSRQITPSSDSRTVESKESRPQRTVYDQFAVWGHHLSWALYPTVLQNKVHWQMSLTNCWWALVKTIMPLFIFLIHSYWNVLISVHMMTPKFHSRSAVVQKKKKKDMCTPCTLLSDKLTTNTIFNLWERPNFIFQKELYRLSNQYGDIRVSSAFAKFRLFYLGWWGMLK